MWRVLSLMVVVCSVCLFSVNAQTVNEKESSVVVGEKAIEVALVLENPGGAFDSQIALELLDDKDIVRSQTQQKIQLKNTRETHKFSISLSDWTKTVVDDLVWYRLRYRIGTNTGIVSLSELIKDDFELRVAAGENLKSGTKYRVRIRALQPYTGKPVAGVALNGSLRLELDTTAEEDELQLNATGATDAEGFAVFDFAIPESAKLDGDGRLKISGAKNGVKREIDEETEALESRGAVFLTADKPIYQPGQTFNVRGLYFDENQKSVASRELEFKIYDEDDTALYRETVKTSAFGIASVSWKIPENAKLGGYRVEVQAEDELQEDTMRFKVTRYDLPNFSVIAKPDKTFYLPHDKIAEIAVRADYLFGKPVSKGKVRVVQEAERHWNYRKQQYDMEEKQTFEGATDAEGVFTARVELNEAFEDLKESDWRRYEDLHFAAYFTDWATNKTEQKRFDVRLSKQPIHVYLVGRRYDQNPNLPVIAYVSTFYADGTPAVCAVEIKGKYDKAKDSQKLAQIKTSSLGAGKFAVSIAPNEDSSLDYELEITARDAKRQIGTFTEEIDFDTDAQLQISTEKTIFKPGESVDVNIVSSEKDALVYLDVMENWTTLDSYFVRLKNGRGSLKIPYNSQFKGDLSLVAYTDENETRYYNAENRAARGIIYPAQQNLKLNTNFTDTVYKPNEEAKVGFSVADGENHPVESALGVVVFDKAVEERARTDADFGSFFSRFSDLMGYGKSFGGISLKDLNELDLSKPISADLQLAAEIILADQSMSPSVFHTKTNPTAAKSVYAEFFRKQFAPVEAALKKQYAKDYAHPTDDASLRKILNQNVVDFDALRDPWNQPYRAAFSTEKSQNVVTFHTSGANKIFGDRDDFTISTSSFSYFTPIGVKIDQAVKDYHRRTGGYIRDEKTLRAELLKLGVDLSNLKDRWNRPYYVTFDVSRRTYLINFYSYGANGVYQPNGWGKDDFTVWGSAIDYFLENDLKIGEILNRTVNRDKKSFPHNEIEFKKLLKENGADFDDLRDGYGNPVDLAFNLKSRYADKTKIENGKQTITPITQEIAEFKIRSRGADSQSVYDDFDLAEFSSVITERSKDTLFSKAEIRNISTSGASGAIRGTVYDPTGAIIPNAEIKAIDEADETKSFSTTANAEGEFLLANIPSGSYRIEIYAVAFSRAVYTNIRVQSQNIVEMKVALQVGAVAETVEVNSQGEVMLNTSSATSASIGKILKGGGGGGGKSEPESTSSSQNFTPRLREYFPETLVWSPELLTDKNGKAEMKFKLADNITTWKLYTIASTKNGKIGVAEKEFQAFQPFFVDLEPPKFLTEGDEIYLPTQIRNYTDAKQKVSVSMAKADWFALLNPANQTVEVGAGNSANAIFGFKTLAAIKDGKQRITAIAAKDSDAIEKSVTVRPNGQEIVRTESKLFQNATNFDLDFPANALPKTQKAELKIYPNLMAHVTESVEGLLQRPYGCGEQTISSTYPNLMILKFTKDDSRLAQTARKYLQRGYERLIGYQVADGGFSYWGGKDAADVALTAYAIRFLTDAKMFVAVDEEIINRAKDWLIKQQRADGSFTKKYYYETAENSSRTKLFTAYVARTLAMLGEKDSAPLEKALAYLKAKNAEIDEPYALSLYALAALDSRKPENAKETLEILKSTAISEADGVYWKLETNTPFYGWGTAGRIETTALVVQALLKSKAQNANGKDEKLDELISKGTLFLLKNKDRYGVWYSTQTTINVLDAFLAALAQNPPLKNQTLQVFLNGAKIEDVAVPAGKIEPLILNLDGRINPANNRLEVKSSDNSSVMSQVVSEHYIDWKNADFANQTANQSRALKLDYSCDKPNAKIMQEITCAVGAERIGFQGYGMLLAEIGIPPGADVSRESLQEALKNDWSLSRYDVLPDRIVLYMWAKAGGTKFNFKFKPRYGIDAQTPASVVYDYYNEEAKATIAPIRFNVK